MSDFITCPICKAVYNPAYLDQVIEHFHEPGFQLKETIKGVKIEDPEEDEQSTSTH